MIRLSQAAVLLVLVAACSGGATNGGGGGSGGGSGGAGGAAGGGTGGSGGGAGGGSGGAGGGSLGGGAGGSGGGFAGDAGSFACDIAPVVQRRCLDCHTNPVQFGAPMPLVTWADTQAQSARVPGQKIYQRMAARVVDAVAPMPQPPNPLLSAGEVTAFANWAAAGAPQGNPATCPVSDAGVVDAGNPDECPAGSTELKITAPAFPISPAMDLYECFAQTISLPGKRHMIKATKVIGDARVLHHMVLFRDPQHSAPAMAANCKFKVNSQVLYAWAPGAGPVDTPADVGIPVNDGDQLVIQIHYNNANNVVGTDSSGAKLCLTDQLRPKEGGVLAVGPAQFSLPPNCPKATTAGDCYNFSGTDYNVFTVWPHMHLKGRALKSTIGSTVVTDRPNYSFGAQYLEKANFVFKKNDTMNTRCTWDTTGVTGSTPFGEDTSQEMCFNFLYVTPVPAAAYCPSIPQAVTCPP